MNLFLFVLAHTSINSQSTADNNAHTPLHHQNHHHGSHDHHLLISNTPDLTIASPDKHAKANPPSHVTPSQDQATPLNAKKTRLANSQESPLDSKIICS
jgi:hypothetical protein